MSVKPSYLNFDIKNYSWKSNIDYRIHPRLYKVGKGEQGVLICEPYKSEILKHWRFKTTQAAKESSDYIYQLFIYYLSVDEFVGADMARKFLQMGFTRAKRYYNYKGGRKYSQKCSTLIGKGTGDPKKELSAKIFYKQWQKAESHNKYKELKKHWKSTYG